MHELGFVFNLLFMLRSCIITGYLIMVQLKVCPGDVNKSPVVSYVVTATVKCLLRTFVQKSANIDNFLKRLLLI